MPAGSTSVTKLEPTIFIRSYLRYRVETDFTAIYWCSLRFFHASGFDFSYKVGTDFFIRSYLRYRVETDFIAIYWFSLRFFHANGFDFSYKVGTDYYY